MIKDIEKKCSVGALLYSPALNSKIAQTVIRGDLGNKYSLALCSEDTISPDMVERAELQIEDTMRMLYEALESKELYLPKLFVRVREPSQMERVFDRIKPYQSIFTGFIFPKYTVSNAEEYNEKLLRVNSVAERKIYMMPILESGDIIDYQTRMEVLSKIKERIDSVNEFVLNVRVGGNDFSNEFAARRHYDETIYDILPIGQLLGDILTVFSRDYIVSGPVWEYFASEHSEWEDGLRRELKLDKLNGFIGKTVIHPKQIPIVNDMLKVTHVSAGSAQPIWVGKKHPI